MKLARLGGVAERFAYAWHNFGLLGASKLYAWDRLMKRSSLSHVSLKALQRPFYFRGFEDFNALSHLMTVGYRICDENAEQKVHWIIDAGSNIGDETIRFFAFHPQAIIVALEPEPRNFDLLQKNMQGLQNVHCIQEGLWSKPSLLKIIPAADHISHRVEEVEEETNATIRATSVPELMQRFSMDRVDVLKMDIEGAEGEVFAADDLSWLAKVRCLIFEVPDNDFPNATQMIYRALDKHRLAFHSYVHGECLILIRSNDGLAFQRTASLDRRTRSR